jgi:hypothetical protein
MLIQAMRLIVSRCCACAASGAAAAVLAADDAAAAVSLHAGSEERIAIGDGWEPGVIAAFAALHESAAGP